MITVRSTLVFVQNISSYSKALMYVTEWKNKLFFQLQHVKQFQRNLLLSLHLTELMIWGKSIILKTSCTVYIRPVQPSVAEYT